jgi:hypothetical protein
MSINWFSMLMLPFLISGSAARPGPEPAQGPEPAPFSSCSYFKFKDANSTTYDTRHVVPGTSPGLGYSRIVESQATCIQCCDSLNQCHMVDSTQTDQCLDTSTGNKLHSVGQPDDLWEQNCKYAESWDFYDYNTDTSYRVECGWEWWQEKIVNNCFWVCSIFDCSKENFDKYSNSNEYLAIFCNPRNQPD